MVPNWPRIKHFVGRHDILESIDDHFLGTEAAGSGVPMFSLSGPGGIGKTYLALEYAHSRQTQFDAIFFLDARSHYQLAMSFGQIATKLGLQAQSHSDDLVSSIKAAKQWLENAVPSRDRVGSFDSGTSCNTNVRITRLPWLIIFDNVYNQDIIDSYLPSRGHGAVLITSRAQHPGQRFHCMAAGVRMDPPTIVDAAALLRWVGGTPTSSKDCTLDEHAASLEMAAYFGNLPLAMTHMASFLRSRNLSMRGFLSLYAKSPLFIKLRLACNVLRNSLYGQMADSLYDFNQLSKEAVYILRLLAFLNPQSIQQYIFLHSPDTSINAKFTKLTTTSATKRALEDYCAQSHFQSVVDELCSSSIIQHEVSKSELKIHPIMQAGVRASMNEHGRYEAFHDAVCLVNHRWPSTADSTQASKPTCEKLLPHMQRLYELYIEYDQEWRHHMVDEEFPELLEKASRYVYVSQKK